jgi:hypothetical protein
MSAVQSYPLNARMKRTEKKKKKQNKKGMS